MKLSIAVLLLFLVGCGGSKQPASQETPVVYVDAATAGAISGKVRFTGKAPVMPVLDMSSNPACEGLNKKLNKKKPRSEQVIVNSNGTLRNTFVWISSGLPKGRWNPPAETVKLNQDGCVYRPHVIGIMVGQTLEIINSDTVNHNIHAEAAVNESWNVNEPPRAENRFKHFTAQEVMFPLSCGVHPWMHGYAGVVAHPFFTVTGDDGDFTLRGVPPGDYILQAVHEQYGKQEVKVAVAKGEMKVIEFRYAPEASNK